MLKVHWFTLCFDSMDVIVVHENAFALQLFGVVNKNMVDIDKSMSLLNGINHYAYYVPT